MTAISDDELIARARAIVGDFACSAEVRAGGVASALVTTAGDVFTGICIDTACSMGHCAESSAISEMLKARQTEISCIVAVGEDGEIMPPCGRCRELIRQVSPANWTTRVIVAHGRTTTLSELMPFSAATDPVAPEA